MSPPAVAIVLAQATQPSPSSKSQGWCFDRGQGAQLCEETEAECNKLRDLNSEIAHSPCKRSGPTGVQVSSPKPTPPDPVAVGFAPHRASPGSLAETAPDRYVTSATLEDQSQTALYRLPTMGAE